MNVCIIPARGGSKRIPRKNVRDFCGRPIISYSIAAARESGLFDRVIVSTDDDEIAEVAERSGAEVPFRRPARLSDDFANTAGVIAHALDWLQESGVSPSHACCVYATAPFLRARDLLEGLSTFDHAGWDFVFSATSFAYPVQRAFLRNRESGLEMLFPEEYRSRSQDLPEVFHDAGQFYWGTREAWSEQRRFFSENSTFVELPRWRVHDIDTEDDWKQAELVWKALMSEPAES